MICLRCMHAKSWAASNIALLELGLTSFVTVGGVGHGIVLSRHAAARCGVDGVIRQADRVAANGRVVVDLHLAAGEELRLLSKESGKNEYIKSKLELTACPKPCRCQSRSCVRARLWAKHQAPR